MRMALFFVGVLLGYVATDMDVVKLCEANGKYAAQLGLGKTIKCEVLK